ncbi:hypothetical protein LTS15_011176 [Exophiala xenobiotica]|nr:hypothetical protein LTS15_011176 [Exophiala xenobiotica]
MAEAAAEHNAQATEDAKKLLAELQGDSEQPKDVFGTSEPKEEGTAADKTNETTKDASEDKRGDGDRPRDHRHERSDRGRGGRGRGRGDRNGHGSRNHRNNIKSDFTQQEISSDPVAIRRQVEFYFSDSNLPKDKFLRESVRDSENNSVDLAKIHDFKRMRHFQPLEAVIEALRESTFVELIDNDTRVRRKELPEDWDDPNKITVFEDAAMPRSVYVKGFGEEVPSTQFDIEAFFSTYGPTKAVRLRRTNDKLFKGSVFVEFETEELQKAFLELDPKPKYKGNDLQIMSKKEYCEKKADDIKEGKVQPNQRYDQGRRNDRNGRDTRRKRDAEDNRDWRTRRDEDKKRGFGDDKRRGDRDSRGGRGGRGGRSYETAKDDRGIPTVKSSSGPKDSGRDDALASARAAVAAENKKDQVAADNVEPTEQNGAADASTATAGKKRAREEDDGEGERETKKVDVKQEDVPAPAAS